MRRSGSGDISLSGAVALVMLGTLGLVSFTFLPVVLGLAAERLELGADEAAMLAFSEMAGSACGALAVILLGIRADWRILACAGLLTAAAGNLVTAYSLDLDSWLLGRFIAGAGSGLALAVKSAAIASLRTPERLFSAVLAAGVLLAVVGLPAFSVAATQWGMRPALTCVAAVCAVGSLAALWIPRRPGRRLAQPGLVAAFGQPGALLASLALFTYYFGIGAFWPFMARFGAAAGMSLQTTGIVLGAAQGGAFLSAILVAWLAGRVGRTLPLMLAYAFFGGGLLMLLPEAPVLFIAANLLLNIAWAVSIPYLLGLLSAFDKLGRIAVFGIVMQTLGLALAPAAIAPLATRFGFSAAIWVSLALFGASAVLTLLAIRRAPEMK